MPYTTRTIPIANLQVNKENYRFEPVVNQRDAISTMVDDQKDKIITLAKDIIGSGLNPSDLPIVVEDKSKNNRFIVLEGNRRVVALKLLHRPSLLSENKSYSDKFRKISKDVSQPIIDKINCIVYDSKDEAMKWIELKHTGENKGIGTIEWTGLQKSRFRSIQQGKPEIALQAIDFVLKSENIDDQTKQKIKDVPITTNLDRLLGDPDIRDVIGLDKTQGKLITKFPREEVSKGLEKIILDLINPINKIKVADIYHKQDRIAYINKFKKKELPDKTKEGRKYFTLDSIPISSGKGKGKGKRSKASTSSRKCIIPMECRIRIYDSRVNDIFVELKGLKVGDFPNACSILSRVFLELSLDSYIEKHPAIGLTDDDKLVKKLRVIADSFEKNDVLTKRQLKPIRLAITSPNKFYSTNTLNAYVHNKNVHPSPKELKIQWNNIQRFVEKLWE